jgi:CO dehydrogenase/acetyl-CoA synthase epsilon subunit
MSNKEIKKENFLNKIVKFVNKYDSPVMDTPDQVVDIEKRLDMEVKKSFCRFPNSEKQG